MFLVLIKYAENDGEVAWEIEGDSFGTLEAAKVQARIMAENRPNTFAVVEVKNMFRRTVTEIVKEESW